MSNLRKPQDKLGLSPRYEPHLTSLDAKENKRIRAERIEKFKDASNSVFTKIGETILNGLHSATIIDTPPDDPRYVRNFGRRIAAGVALSAVLVVGGSAYEKSSQTPSDCVSVSLEELGTSDPIEGSRAVSKRFVGEAARPDATEMARQFDEQGYIKECYSRRVKAIYLDLADN